MKRTMFILIFLSLIVSVHSQDRSVALDIAVSAPTSQVWDVITNPEYAKILGNEFDKGAFVESEWKLGSDVHFKYEPDRLISTGTISRLVKEELIQIDYDFSGFKYNEKYMLTEQDGGCTMAIAAGPYGSDYEAQVAVWKNWLQKVKELSEEK